MEIYVFKQGKTLGPFGEQATIDRVDRGEFAGSDLAKVEGMQEWMRLDELIVREPEAWEPKKTALQAVLQQPARLGGVALGAGCVLMVLSHWPVLIYGPFFLGAIAVSFFLFHRMRPVSAILLLACTAILPAAIWRLMSNPLLAPELGGVPAPAVAVASPSPSPAPEVKAVSPSPTPAPIAAATPSQTPAAPAATPEASPREIAAASTPAPAVAEASPTPKTVDPLDSQIAAATEAYQSARSSILNDGSTPAPTPRPASTPAPAPATSPMPALVADPRPMPGQSGPAFPSLWPTPAPELDPGVVADISSKVYLVDTGEAKGTGFLMQMGNGIYFVTNFHVASAAKALACSNPGDSFTLAGGEIDVATDRDLVRFPIRRTAGLKTDPLPLLGQDAFAWGNSGGQDVVTQLDGKVLGVGPGQIEVSTAFIPGNSGGPITTGSGQVMAVATYVARDSGVPAWVKSGTRFTGTRRFGVRITSDIRWTPMSFAAFQDQSKRIADKEDLLNDLSSMAQKLTSNYQQGPIRTRFMDIEGVANFVNSYNRPGWKNASQLRQMSHDLGQTIYDIRSDMDFRFQDIQAPYLKTRLDEVSKGMEAVSGYLKGE